ncbi:MAG: trigger factor, partial [Ruminococcaceae bacterium]|nr:trigger factor [Oscillospiraceae bacterium]
AMQSFERRMMQQGLSLQKYLEITGQEYNSLRDMFKVNAERDVKIRLALEKIAEIEKIIIEEEDVNKEYEMFAQETGTEVEKLKSDYVTESIIKDLSLRKAFEVVRNNAVVTEAVEAPAEEAPVEEKPKKRTRKKAEKAEEKPEETAESAE